MHRGLRSHDRADARHAHVRAEHRHDPPHHTAPHTRLLSGGQGGREAAKEPHRPKGSAAHSTHALRTYITRINETQSVSSHPITGISPQYSHPLVVPRPPLMRARARILSPLLVLGRRIPCGLSRLSSPEVLRGPVHPRRLDVPPTAERAAARHVQLNGGTHTVTVSAALFSECKSDKAFAHKRYIEVAGAFSAVDLERQWT